MKSFILAISFLIVTAFAPAITNGYSPVSICSAIQKPKPPPKPGKAPKPPKPKPPQKPKAPKPAKKPKTPPKPPWVK